MSLVDKPGTVLAEAHYSQGERYIEIHFVGHENWYYCIDGIPPEEQSSFLGITVHEILVILLKESHVVRLKHVSLVSFKNYISRCE